MLRGLFTAPQLIESAPSERVFGWVVPMGGDAIAVKSHARLLDVFHGIATSDGKLSDDAEGYGRAFAANVWAYRCINILANTVASVPLEIVGYDDEPIEDHPLGRRLITRPDIMRVTVADLHVFGDAYWSLGKGGAVERINPSTVTLEVQRGDQGEYVQYVQRLEGRVVATWTRITMTHFPFYDPLDDLHGLSPMKVALQSIRTQASVSNYAERYFENDAVPPIVLSTEQIPPEADMRRLEAEWNRKYGGTENAGKAAFLFGGLTVETLSPPLKDLVMTDLRAEERREIAGAFGVPTTLALADDAANYATMKEQHQVFYTTTVLPLLENTILPIINQRMIQFASRPALVRARREDIEVLQEDRTEITQRNAQGITAGYLSLNDAREREGMEKLPLDYFVIQGRLVPREAVEAGDLEAINPPAPQAAPGGFPFGALPELPPAKEPPQLTSGPQKAIVDIVVHAPDTVKAHEMVIQDTMLKDLSRWQRKVAKKSPDVAFSPDYLPRAVTDWLRADLRAWDGETPREEWVKAAFIRAEETIKADDPDLATLEEFEAYWRGIGDLFDRIAVTFLASFDDLPDVIVQGLRNAGATGAEFDLQTALADFERQLTADLVGTEDAPGPLVAIFGAGAARGDDLLRNAKSVKQGGEMALDWQLVDTLARDWARQYAAEMVRGINDTTLRIFRKKIAEWIDKGGTLEDLAKFIEGELAQIPEGWLPGRMQWATSRERARLIAQHETTTVFHEGAVTRWEQANVPQKKFRTQRDSLVCAICRPLNNEITTLRGLWTHPGGQGEEAKYKGRTYTIPAHVGCRCFPAPSGVLHG